MPWSNKGGNGGSGGGSGGGGGGWKGGGPWGQGPSSGGSGQNPDIEDILKRSQDRLKQAMPGGGGSKFLFVLIGLLAAGVIAFYGFTVTVEPEEIGIVTQFGKYNRRLEPGLNFRLPYPIEEVFLPKVTRANRTEIGFETSGDSLGGGGSNRDVPGESLMLTGDENIVNIDFVVFWQIKTAQDLLFKVRDGEAVLDTGQAPTVKDVAESAMREIVGKGNIQAILTQDRAKIEQEVMDLIQKTLDRYESGIQVTQVLLQKVDPPDQVIGAFRDVQAAKADQDRAQNEAQSYANKVVPEARGNAEQITQAAQGYKEQVIAEAKGTASRFLKVYEEYKKAPDVTRKRIYLETMEQVFSKMDKIIIDQKGGGQGVVPYLPLNDLSKGKAAEGGQ